MGISGESYYDADRDDVDDDDDDPDEDDMILTDQKWKLLVTFMPMMTAEGETFQALTYRSANDICPIIAYICPIIAYNRTSIVASFAPILVEDYSWRII